MNARKGRKKEGNRIIFYDSIIPLDEDPTLKDAVITKYKPGLFEQPSSPETLQVNSSKDEGINCRFRSGSQKK